MPDYRRPSTKCVRPVPPEFAATFVEGGWRKIERVYHARTDLLTKWKAIRGDDVLKSLRDRFMGGDKTALDEARALDAGACSQASDGGTRP